MTPEAFYDRALARADQATERGFVYNDDATKSPHLIDVAFGTAPGGLVNEPPAAEGYGEDWEGRVYAWDGGTAWVAESEDFSRAQRVSFGGDEHPLKTKWFLLDQSAERARFGLASFLLNTELGEALLLGYELMGRVDLLDRAEAIAHHFAARIEEDGKYRRQWQGAESGYNGRIQSLVMEHIRWVLEHRPGIAALESALETLGDTYEHTTEDKINHQTSAQFGRLEADPSQLGAIEQDTLDSLALIEEDGRLPYTLPTHKNHPIYKENYLSYDVYLYNRLAPRLTIGQQVVDTVFEPGGFFDYSVATRNTKHYLARNLLGLAYAARHFGHEDPRASGWIDDFLAWTAPNTSFKASYQMLGAAAAMMLDAA
jgi:hypothetical protein